jgi:hypothetical protein
MPPFESSRYHYLDQASSSWIFGVSLLLGDHNFVCGATSLTRSRSRALAVPERCTANGNGENKIYESSQGMCHALGAVQNNMMQTSILENGKAAAETVYTA